MTKLVNDIGCIISAYNDLSKIRVSADNYVNLHKHYSNMVEFITDKDVLKTGCYAHIFGIPIYVTKDLCNNVFQVNLNDKWSVPIKFDDIGSINKILQLQAFW